VHGADEDSQCQRRLPRRGISAVLVVEFLNRGHFPYFVRFQFSPMSEPKPMVLPRSVRFFGAEANAPSLSLL
jgi:hypothetical protein